jgi:hypothetical protein
LVVAGVVLATAVLVTIALSSSASVADRLAAAADVFAGATLLLAIIAALVALLAYAVSTGPPDLRLSVRFEFSYPNEPVFTANVESNGWIKAKEFKQTCAVISFRNYSGYSAKNPALIVRAQAMAFLPNQVPSNESWIQIDFVNTVGMTAVQWDGGPMYSIHGHSVRRLPSLDLGRLWHIPDWGNPTFTFEILADGYRREVTLPVEFTMDPEAQSQLAERGKASPEWV